MCQDIFWHLQVYTTSSQTISNYVGCLVALEGYPVPGAHKLQIIGDSFLIKRVRCGLHMSVLKFQKGGFCRAYWILPSPLSPTTPLYTCHKQLCVKPVPCAWRRRFSIHGMLCVIVNSTPNENSYFMVHDFNFLLQYLLGRKKKALSKLVVYTNSLCISISAWCFCIKFHRAEDAFAEVCSFHHVHFSMLS